LLIVDDKINCEDDSKAIILNYLFISVSNINDVGQVDPFPNRTYSNMNSIIVAQYEIKNTLKILKHGNARGPHCITHAL